MKRTALVLAISAASLAACQKAPEADVAATASAPAPEVVAAAAPVSLTPPPPAIVEGKPVPVVAHPDPLSVLRSADPALAANKRLLFDMWRTALNAGHLEVLDDMVAEDYIQHSPFQRSGRDAMKETFSVIPRSETIPEVMRPAPVTFIAEGNLVVFAAIDTYQEPDGSGPYTTTHFNMFGVRDGRLAEHWHPDQSPPCPGLPSAAEGGPQPVTGATGLDQYALLSAATPELAANKRLVFDMWRQLVDAGREEVADLYLAEDYIQHNPNAATGREGAKAYFATQTDQPIESSIRAPLVAMLAEGDVVVQVIKVELPDPYREGQVYTTVWMDMYRIADGRIAEHWDAAVKPGTSVEEMGAACAEPAA
jgi:predicted SnoaL-like aldol condensation-catalyzing enzyme